MEKDATEATTEGGRPEEFTGERVLAVFTEDADPCEPLTASEVGEGLGCSRRTALDKLNDLADNGALDTKKVGGRSRVYWRPGGGSDGA